MSIGSQCYHIDPTPRPSNLAWMSCLQSGAIPAMITNAPLHSLLVYYIEHYGYEKMPYLFGEYNNI